MSTLSIPSLCRYCRILMFIGMLTFFNTRRCLSFSNGIVRSASSAFSASFKSTYLLKEITAGWENYHFDTIDYSNRHTHSDKPLRRDRQLSKLYANSRERNVAVPRGAGTNFAAKWQEKGNYYTGFENIRSLNDKLHLYQRNRSTSEKHAMLDELSITYFARFHNIIREEYQHEKKLVEERIVQWPLKRLQREGYALIDCTASSKGTLFLDKVYRFELSTKEVLPFHRFSVGDTVRISVNRGGYDPLGADSIDGVVLDRRARYIDICIKEAAASSIKRYDKYRLDTFVNRVVYDRMIESLQLFLSPTASDAFPISKILKDLLLYSYPNSMMMIAASPGGLKMALPLAMTATGNAYNTSTYGSAAISGSYSVDEEDVRYMASVTSSELQLQQSMSALPKEGVKKNKSKSVGTGGREPLVVDGVGLGLHPTTVSKALKVTKEDSESYVSPERLSHTDYPSTPIFLSNNRLKAMAEHSPAGHQYGREDLYAAIEGFCNTMSPNPSQMEAIIEAIVRPLCLVQGPPGTGKTKVACITLATISHLQKQQKLSSKTKILTCAHSNIATDNLLEGLLAMGLNVVRIGRPVNVRSVLWNSTIDSLLLKESQWVKARATLDEAIAEFNEVRSSHEGGEALGSVQWALGSAKKRFELVESRCIHRILNDADVVVSTTIGAGTEVLKEYVRSERVRFGTVLIDEAAQCMEPALLPAVIHGCERLILIGDQNQLPPVVLSANASKHGLGISLFSRLIAGGLAPKLLTEQYRMHPKICEFPSNQFYAGLVKSRVKAVDRPLPKGLQWPNEHVPVVFINVPAAAVAVDGNEGKSNGTQTSYSNTLEADVVLEVVKSLYAHNTSLSDIGVLSPYNAQVRLLTDLFRSEGWIDVSDATVGANVTANATVIPTATAAATLTHADQPDVPMQHIEEYDDVSVKKMKQQLLLKQFAAIIDGSLYTVEDESEDDKATTSNRGTIEVRSVDGYQGREKEIVIISAVRSNSNGRVGFLRDWRRLNVAITRAKRGLVVVGDQNTLQHDVHWHQLICWCKQHDCFVDSTTIEATNSLVDGQ